MSEYVGTASDTATAPMEDKHGGRVTMPREAVQRMLKGRGYVFVADVQGRLMASDACWITEAARLDDLFAWWNLKVEPGAYQVDERVTRTLGEVPDLASFLKLPSDAIRVQPVRVGRLPLMFSPPDYPMFVLFTRPDGKRFGLNFEFLNFAMPGWDNDDVHLVQSEAEPHSAVYLGTGKTADAVLMPVRID